MLRSCHISAIPYLCVTKHCDMSIVPLHVRMLTFRSALIYACSSQSRLHCTCREQQVAARWHSVCAALAAQVVTRAHRRCSSLRLFSIASYLVELGLHHPGPVWSLWGPRMHIFVATYLVRQASTHASIVYSHRTLSCCPLVLSMLIGASGASSLCGASGASLCSLRSLRIGPVRQPQGLLHHMRCW